MESKHAFRVGSQHYCWYSRSSILGKSLVGYDCSVAFMCFVYLSVNSLINNISNNNNYSNKFGLDDIKEVNTDNEKIRGRYCSGPFF